MRKFWRHTRVMSRRRLRQSRLLQIGAIVGLWWLCDLLARQLMLAVPGGVIGMIVLLAFLASGRLRASTLGKGADSLIAEMLLFFVPAVMVLIDMPQMLGWLGLKLLIAVVAGTGIVMLTTAFTVHTVMQWGRSHAE
jgi:holin-like protein